MMIQVAKYAGTSSVPVSAILKAGSHVTKIIGFHAILQIALVLGIGFCYIEYWHCFFVVMVFYSIPEVYWILVLLWAVLDFGITLEWGPNLAYCLEVTLFLYANPCLHLVKWFPYFSQK